MAVITVAGGEEVLAAHHNALAGLVNGTVGYGQPVKHTVFDDSAIYSVTVGNQDTTNGLALKVQCGPVASPTTIALFNKTGVTFSVPATFSSGISPLILTDGTAAAPSLSRSGDSDTGWYPDSNGLAWSINGVEVARQRAAGLEAKLRDKGGAVFFLDAYAGGTTINDGAGDPDAAWTAALAAVTAWRTAAGVSTGGTIQLGAGVYLAATSAITLLDGITIRGSGIDSTVIKRRNSSTRSPIFAFGRSDITVCDLTIDGNRTNNLSLESSHSEITIDPDTGVGGVDNTIYNVKVTNFNSNGIACGGQRNTVAHCRIEGPALASYAAWVGLVGGGGLYGIFTPGNTTCTDVAIIDCHVTGLRMPGIFVGGVRPMIIGNRVSDVHRELDGDGSGGGAIALAMTSSGSQAPSHAIIANNTVGPPGIGSNCSGIEVSEAFSCLVMNNTVHGVATGIQVSLGTGVQVIGGSVFNCTTGFFAAASTEGWSLSGVNFITNTTAIQTAANADDFSIIGCYLNNNTANWTNAGGGTNYETLGNITVTGTAIANRHVQALTVTSAVTSGYLASLTNSHATGYGLQVLAGSTTASYALDVRTYNSSAALLQVSGNGRLVSTVSGTRALAVDDTRNVMLGDGANALSTAATAGFLWLPYSLGKPAGTPTSGLATTGSVPISIDLTNNKIAVWTGGAWIGATLAAY